MGDIGKHGKRVGGEQPRGGQEKPSKKEATVNGRDVAPAEPKRPENSRLHFLNYVMDRELGMPVRRRGAPGEPSRHLQREWTRKLVTTAHDEPLVARAILSNYDLEKLDDYQKTIDELVLKYIKKFPLEATYFDFKQDDESLSFKKGILQTVYESIAPFSEHLSIFLEDSISKKGQKYFAELTDILSVIRVLEELCEHGLGQEFDPCAEDEGAAAMDACDRRLAEFAATSAKRTFRDCARSALVAEKWEMENHVPGEARSSGQAQSFSARVNPILIDLCKSQDLRKEEGNEHLRRISEKMKHAYDEFVREFDLGEKHEEIKSSNIDSINSTTETYFTDKFDNIEENIEHSSESMKSIKRFLLNFLLFRSHIGANDPAELDGMCCAMDWFLFNEKS